MNKWKSIFNKIVIIILANYASSTQAEGLYANLSLKHIKLSDSNYSFKIDIENDEFLPSLPLSLELGYKKSNYLFSIEFYPTHYYVHKKQSYTYIESRSQSLNAAYLFKNDRIDYLLGLGLYQWETEAFFDNAFFDNDSLIKTNGNSLSLNTGIIYTLVDTIHKDDAPSQGLQALLDYKVVVDVSEENLHIISLGLRFQF